MCVDLRCVAPVYSILLKVIGGFLSVVPSEPDRLALESQRSESIMEEPRGADGGQNLL